MHPDQFYKIKRIFKYLGYCNTKGAFVYINNFGSVTFGNSEDYFNVCEFKEIELVDAKRFTTQQEIYEYLAMGNKIISHNNGDIVYFKDGTLNIDGYKFCEPSNWTPYTKHKAWYEIDNKLTLCVVTRADQPHRNTIACVRYSTAGYFMDELGNCYDTAKPVTIDDIKECLFNAA